MKVLIMLTSHKDGKGKKSKFLVEDFAAPYYFMEDAGIDLSIATASGKLSLFHPKSKSSDPPPAATQRFHEDTLIKSKLEKTLKICDVNQADYDGVFYARG